jgi:hypothetical protein
MHRDVCEPRLILTSCGIDDPAVVVPKILSRDEIDSVLLGIGSRLIFIELEIHKGIEMDLVKKFKANFRSGASSHQTPVSLATGFPPTKNPPLIEIRGRLASNYIRGKSSTADFQAGSIRAANRDVSVASALVVLIAGLVIRVAAVIDFPIPTRQGGEGGDGANVAGP